EHLVEVGCPHGTASEAFVQGCYSILPGAGEIVPRLVERDQKTRRTKPGLAPKWPEEAGRRGSMIRVSGSPNHEKAVQRHVTAANRSGAGVRDDRLLFVRDGATGMSRPAQEAEPLRTLLPGRSCGVAATRCLGLRWPWFDSKEACDSPTIVGARGVKLSRVFS